MTSTRPRRLGLTEVTVLVTGLSDVVKYPGEHSGKKEGFVLAQSSGVQPIMMRAVVARARGSWSHCIHRQASEGSWVYVTSL